MAEWSIALVLKTNLVRGTGSNPVTVVLMRVSSVAEWVPAEH